MYLRSSRKRRRCGVASSSHRLLKLHRGHGDAVFAVAFHAGAFNTRRVLVVVGSDHIVPPLIAAIANQPCNDLPPLWTASTSGAICARCQSTAARESVLPWSNSMTKNRREPVLSSVRVESLPSHLRCSSSANHRRWHDELLPLQLAAPFLARACAEIVLESTPATQQRVAWEKRVHDPAQVRHRHQQATNG